MEDVPDITVELTERRSIALESTLAGVLAGGCLVLVVEAGVASVGAIGFPSVFQRPTAPAQWGFHLLFASAFGTVFGLLVNNRPFWWYGRGFLGPAVGAVFGVVLWIAANVLVWPFFQSLVGPLFGGSPTPGLALASYVAYGILVGTLTNVALLIRA